MKKAIVFKIFFIYFLFNCYSFPIADYYWVRSPEDVIKIQDNVGILFNKSYQIRNTNEFNIDENGWFNTSYCGTKMYIIFGSNYFVYHSDKDLYYPESSSKFNFGSSFYKNEDFDNAIKTLFFYGYGKKTSIDDYFPQIKGIIKSIDVPDILEEKSINKLIKYNTYDMEHYYVIDWETNTQLFRYGAIPWATSKEPIGMKIEMNFSNPQNSIVILNGYVHPDKRYLYKANRRVKKIKITSPDCDFSIIDDFEDVVHFHEIKLPNEVMSVTIEILDFYEGNKYKDLCIQMFGIKNFVYEDRKEFLDFSDLSYRGRYTEYQKNN